MNMENYKEFSGKNLDEAMASACEYYGLERGKLEIEILNDAKSGIFGLVGAKKACVRARKAQLESFNLKVGENRNDKKAGASANLRQEKPRGDTKNDSRHERESKPLGTESQVDDSHADETHSARAAVNQAPANVAQVALLQADRPHANATQADRPNAGAEAQANKQPATEPHVLEANAAPAQNRPARQQAEHRPAKESNGEKRLDTHPERGERRPNNRPERATDARQERATDARQERSESRTGEDGSAENRPNARPERSERQFNGRSNNRPDRGAEGRTERTPNNRPERSARPQLANRQLEEVNGNLALEINGNRLEPDRFERSEASNAQNGRGRLKPERSSKPSRLERAERPERPERAERPKQMRTDKPETSEDGEIDDKFPEIQLEGMDLALLESEVLTAVDSMTRHIVGETEKEFELSGGKARVRINSGEDSGLLIGRDGQTLSALQYLASCIVSRRLQASVRVQIDAGDYRSRQLEKLRATALELAEKVKETGKSQSTRPISAYLRRVVHMALEEDPDVQTHSKGEGSLKRVVIVPKKNS